MPRLNFPISQAGLEIPVLVGLDGQTTTALHTSGQPISPPILVRGLLDTGSDATSVAPWILKRLGVGSGTVASTRTAAGIIKVYLHHVSVGILDPTRPGSSSFSLPTVLISEMPFLLPDADVLIGMNVLLECKLLLDGPARQVAIEF